MLRFYARWCAIFFLPFRFDSAIRHAMRDFSRLMLRCRVLLFAVIFAMLRRFSLSMLIALRRGFRWCRYAPLRRCLPLRWRLPCCAMPFLRFSLRYFYAFDIFPDVSRSVLCCHCHAYAFFPFIAIAIRYDYADILLRYTWLLMRHMLSCWCALMLLMPLLRVIYFLRYAITRFRRAYAYLPLFSRRADFAISSW